MEAQIWAVPGDQLRINKGEKTKSAAGMESHSQELQPRAATGAPVGQGRQQQTWAGMEGALQGGHWSEYSSTHKSHKSTEIQTAREYADYKGDLNIKSSFLM